MTAVATSRIRKRAASLCFEKEQLIIASRCNEAKTTPSICCFSAQIVAGTVTSKTQKKSKNPFFHDESLLGNFS